MARRSARYRESALLFVLASALLVLGCHSTDPATETEEPTVDRHAAALGPTSDLSLDLPSDRAITSLALVASNSLSIADGVVIEEAVDSTMPAAIANTGTATTELGTDSRSGDVIAGGSLVLRNRARVDGDVVAGGSIDSQHGAVVTGVTTTNAAPPLRHLHLPFGVNPGSTAVNLEPGQTASAAPGAYSDFVVKPRSTLHLVPGRYELDRLQVDPQAHLAVDTSSGPVLLLVRSGIDFKGSIDESGGSGAVLVAYSGSQAISIESPFHGTIFAPFAALRLAPVGAAGHRGSFFAKDLRVEARTPVVFEPFSSWAELFGLHPFLTCLSQSRVDSAAGLLGYRNDNAAPVDLPLGVDNSLLGAVDSVPPSTFAPGTTRYGFYAYFDPTRGPVRWSLLGTTVSADAASARCGATDVVSLPATTFPVDSPGAISAAALARLRPDTYGPEASFVPLPPATSPGSPLHTRSGPAPSAPDSLTIHLSKVQTARCNPDGILGQNISLRSVVVDDVSLPRRDLSRCYADGCADDLGTSVADDQENVAATFDIWTDCGSYERYDVSVQLLFDARSGQVLGGGYNDLYESLFIDADTHCLASLSGASLCWEATTARAPDICFDWKADFVDSGPWSNGASEDFAAARGVQSFPANRALAEVIVHDETRERFHFNGILDDRGCVPRSAIAPVDTWVRGNGFGYLLRLRPELCADPSGAQCASTLAEPRGAANVTVANTDTSGVLELCWVDTEEPVNAPANCRVRTAAQGAFAGWTANGPPSTITPPPEVTTENPSTRVAAVIGQILRREQETNGDLSVGLGLLERRLDGRTSPTIFATQACPGNPNTACAAGNNLYLEPDFVQRPDVPGSNRFKFVVAHEFGHFFQFAAQGAPTILYGANDTNDLCACRHVPAVDSAHCMQSVEGLTGAQAEGYAHFLSAKTWNRETDTDCTFNYYKEFLDQSCVPGSEQCEPYASNGALRLSRPPLPLSCSSRRLWRNVVCEDGTQTPDKSLLGVELDWLTFFWNLNANQDPALHWSTRNIADAYVSACGGSSCGGQTLTWARLLSGVDPLNLSATAKSQFAREGRANGVDDQR